MREAPSVVIINKLIELGAKVKAYDPEAMENAKFYLGDKIEFALNQYDCLKDADALLVLTEWNEFKNPDLLQMKEELKNPIIFDGRNIYNRRRTEEAGFYHYSIGKTPVKPE
jgi:UDPglucose 6-dehydrogenase